MNPSFKQILIKSFQFDGGKEKGGEREKAAEKRERDSERER